MNEITVEVVTAVVPTLVGAAIIALVVGAWNAQRNRNDSKKIYEFLLTSKSDTNYVFRSTESIASDTNLTKARVEKLCTNHAKIRRNEKEKDSWALAE